ncbi:MAG: hypothetical protein E6J29_08320 [Chloroflexi bacterium]|nr:MAG: hypothetical protein E6J29_08320 [Chloroflexota bacterium]TMD51206.1 MAG: hypothetical protein E6I85_13615 [Chloroflexota bacterium]
MATAARPRTLDDLAELGPDELLALYHNAKTPRVEDLRGKLKGRMLASPLAKHGAVADFLKHFAADGPMPWQGKTFRPLSKDRGEGINRVFGNRANWYRFETFVGPSRAGDFDALQLDYDQHGNPFFVRAVKDEVREVAPGLWLGLAYLHTKKKDRLGIFFALAGA